MTYRTAQVVSSDGTPIAYRVYGRGPGLVLLHGGAGAAQSLGKLAASLATDFTVHVPDRRGRGHSGPFGPDHGLATECADLDALLRETGARAVFGLSAGAVIALHAATQLTEIDRLALYEPPLIVDGATPEAWVPRYERALDRGDLGAALAAVLKGTRDDRSWLGYIPSAVLRPLLRFAIRREPPREDRIPMRELVPTLREDAKLVREAVSLVASLDAVRADVLLLGGARSARDLRVGLAALARRLPRAKRVILPSVGHTAAHDEGRPELVARELRAFFTVRR
jgi:pimeloyl-ACP methyl ester carboxylesterase